MILSYNDRDRVLKPLLLRETKVEAFSVVLRVRKKMHALFTSKQIRN